MKVDHIHWLGHASFRLEDGEHQIYIDPWKLGENAPRASVILITHDHYDHFSMDDIARIEGPDTVFVAPADVTAKLGERKKITAAPGGEYEAGPVKVEAVPAYNMGKPFHGKEKGWVGYIVTLSSGQRIYHAGDTDAIPEMKSFRVDVALLPCGGTYTMTAREMAEAANEMKPEVLIPMHWGDIVGSKEDAQTVERTFKGKTAIRPVER